MKNLRSKSALYLLFLLASFFIILALVSCSDITSRDSADRGSVTFYVNPQMITSAISSGRSLLLRQESSELITEEAAKAEESEKDSGLTKEVTYDSVSMTIAVSGSDYDKTQKVTFTSEELANKVSKALTFEDIPAETSVSARGFISLTYKQTFGRKGEDGALVEEYSLNGSLVYCYGESKEVKISGGENSLDLDLEPVFDLDSMMKSESSFGDTILFDAQGSSEGKEGIFALSAFNTGYYSIGLNKDKESGCLSCGTYKVLEVDESGEEPLSISFRELVRISADGKEYELVKNPADVTVDTSNNSFEINAANCTIKFKKDSGSGESDKVTYTYTIEFAVKEDENSYGIVTVDDADLTWTLECEEGKTPAEEDVNGELNNRLEKALEILSEKGYELEDSENNPITAVDSKDETKITYNYHLVKKEVQTVTYTYTIEFAVKEDENSYGIVTVDDADLTWTLECEEGKTPAEEDVNGELRNRLEKALVILSEKGYELEDSENNPIAAVDSKDETKITYNYHLVKKGISQGGSLSFEPDVNQYIIISTQTEEQAAAGIFSFGLSVDGTPDKDILADVDFTEKKEVGTNPDGTPIYQSLNLLDVSYTLRKGNNVLASKSISTNQIQLPAMQKSGTYILDITVRRGADDTYMTADHQEKTLPAFEGVSATIEIPISIETSGGGSSNDPSSGDPSSGTSGD